MELTMEVAVQDQCRLCNAAEPGVVTIFWDDQENSYAQKIQEWFQLLLVDTPYWPRRCCSRCANFMEEMKLFKDRIVERHCALDEIFVIMENKQDTRISQEETEPLPEHAKEENLIESVFIVEDPVCKTEEITSSEVVIVEDEEADEVSPGTKDEKLVEEKSSVVVKDAQESIRCPEKNYDPETFKCQKCGKSLRSLVALSTHNRRKHPERRELVCETCGRTFAKLKYYNSHVSTAHLPENQEKKKCSICDKVFVNAFVMRRHIQRIHEKVYSHTCDICGKAFPDPYYLTMHLKRHEAQNEITPKAQPPNESQLEECNICHKHFYKLAQHQMKSHGVSPRPRYKWRSGKLVCDKCGRYFDRSNLAKHKITCGKPRFADEESVKCKLCKKVFSANRNLKRHIIMVHNQTREIACPFCDFKSISIGNRLRHFRYSHPEEYEKCKVKATVVSDEPDNQSRDQDQELTI